MNKKELRGRGTVFSVLFPALIQLAIVNVYPSTAAHAGNGSTDDPYIVPMTSSTPRVDGVLDEFFWESALKLDLAFEVMPGENVTPPVRTEVLIVYDESNLYAAFKCFDPEPSAIQAHFRDRDRLGNEDCVGICLDTFNDERSNYLLMANPIGIQSDHIESETGGSSWDAIWESAGQITEWGYQVEMKVPFNQLRFQRVDGTQVWGFDAVRIYPRSHQHLIGTFARDRSNNCYRCQMLKIEGFHGATPGHNVEISPTVTGVRTELRDNFPSGDLQTDHEEIDFGITTKWGVTPNLVFSGTVNPDFSQVEADAFQLDINQPFALYYGERRPFFTEGADFFNTLKSAVYTRTIRDPSWGLKLTGKEGANTVGAYVVRDEITNLIFPGSQDSRSTSLDMNSAAAVLRYKRDIGSRYTVGALFTDREGTDYFNRLAGLDLDLRVTQSDQIQLHLLGSSTSYPAETAAAFDQDDGTLTDGFVAFEWDHSTRTHYIWLDYDEVGKDFRADLGFIPMVGYRNVEGGYFYTWNAEQGSWWDRLRLGGELAHYEEREGGLLAKEGNIWGSYSGSMRSYVSFEASGATQAYNGLLFDLTRLSLYGEMRPFGDLAFGLNVLVGDHIDYSNTRGGERLYLRPWVDINMGKHLIMGLWHTYEHLDVNPGRLYTANISHMSFVYQINRRMFFRSIIQYVRYKRNTENYTFDIDPEFENFFSQFLFSYKINPQTMLYLGYNGNHLGNQDFSLTQSDRTFFMKIGYALSI
ncbi:MAG: carbohydrate binding family 9 domain-containing protein [Candidatus Latescibacterota bacterium]|nr:MAG: carbohydrate binding family 9 domain-containing protein [Candidatus Latescibacterota bacterium]